MGVNSAESGDEMVFQCADGSFGGIGSMFFGGDALEGDVVFGECIFQILGAFIVQYVKIGSMTVSYKSFVFFPRLCGYWQPGDWV
jgi:hypothetical protein